MKILQITNIVSHHQLPLAVELFKLVGEENFLFAALGRPTSERLNNGWSSDYNESWIVHPNESASDNQRYNDFWSAADIVICGERLIERMQERVDNNKICFYMSERWWKPPVGIARLLSPSYLNMFLSFRRLTKSKYFHYLAIGPFAANDMRFVTTMKNRIWQWGYFTDFSLVQDLNKSSSHHVIKVLWIGRMINLKRVDLLIKALGRIQSDGKEFKLTLIGDGPEKIRLEKLASKCLTRSSYEFLDFIPSSEVPSLMSRYDIYVLPSNAYEGWGAVVNEAMAAGCAVIASDKTGAGVSLIQSKNNGLLFKSGSEDSLYKSLKLLFEQPELIKQYGKNARSTIEQEWQPKVVAYKLIKLSELLLQNESITRFFSDGPLKNLNYK